MKFGEIFLVDRDRFVFPAGGESCGQYCRTINMVGGPYTLRGMSEMHDSICRASFSECLVDDRSSEQSPKVEVEVRRADEAWFHQIDIDTWDYTFDLDPGPDGLRLVGRNFLGLVDLRPRVAATLWLNEGSFDARFAIQNSLRVLVAHRLVELGGLLLHSSCVVDDGLAYLFFGPSGAGKSTIAGLAADSGLQVLGDDMNLILTTADVPMVELFPLSGDQRFVDFGRESFPLAGAFRLRQSGAESSSPMGSALAYASLYSCAPYLNNDPHREEQLAHTLGTIAATVPVSELQFRRAATWDQIRPCLKESS